MYLLGIDVGKSKLDICLLYEGIRGKRKTKSLSNTVDAPQKLMTWIADRHLALCDIRVVIEATGIYHENLAYGLHELGLQVTIANPHRVREFAKGLGILTKTDTVDAYVLACYGELSESRSWMPPAEEVRVLKALLRRRDALLEDVMREENRLEKATATSTPTQVKESIHKMCHLTREELNAVEKLISEHVDNHPGLKKDLGYLTTIKGVGPQLGLNILVILRGNHFRNAEQVAAYLGVVPVEKRSGTSVRGRPRLSKTGPSEIRAKLFISALTAVRYNKQIKAQYERLLARGKTKMSALGAAMRKLVHICYGVLTHQQAYDENYNVVA